MRKVQVYSKLLDRSFDFYVGSFVMNAVELDAEGFFAVNLTAEYPELPSSLQIPIKDFHVPSDVANFKDSLMTIMQKSLEGQDVFFGCMGGIGRTGIVLGSILKVMGVENINLLYSTRQLLPHALETPEQVEFIKSLDVGFLQSKLEDAVVEHDLKNIAYKKLVAYTKKKPQKSLELVARLGTIKEVAGLVKDNHLAAQEVIDSARHYGNRQLVKDLLVMGITGENLADKFFSRLLRLTSRLEGGRNDARRNKL